MKKGLDRKNQRANWIREETLKKEKLNELKHQSNLRRIVEYRVVANEIYIIINIKISTLLREAGDIIGIYNNICNSHVLYYINTEKICSINKEQR